MVEMASATSPTAATVSKPSQLPLGPLMVDVRGAELRAEEADFLRHPAVGAVILFARNCHEPAQVAALTRAIHALRAPPLWVAVDQEGGRVQRLTNGFYALPAAARLGALYDRDREMGVAMASAAGCLMAAQVRQVGVDFSFAPVLDCQRPGSQVLGDRAFHAQPSSICAIAGAYIAGMRRAGMAATAKHFPGHGGVEADSHTELPVDSRPLSALKKRDLWPFAQLADQLGGVMTAHVLFGKIHADLPTYSPFWLRDILRTRLGFAGVIFSDDLSMKGAAGHLANPASNLAADDGNLGIRAQRALAAGCDMALICNAPEAARRAADHLGQQHRPDSSRLAAMQARAADIPTAELAKMATDLDRELPA